MKDKSIELKLIIEEVKKSLGVKVKDLVAEESCITETHLNINNINGKIIALEKYATEIKTLYSSKSDIIINFRKRAADIKTEIELIGSNK